MSRLSLNNPLRGPCPPGGYRWVCPETGFTSHAWDYRTWVEQAVKHYLANDREVPPTLQEDMQEQLCLTLPPGWCNYDDPNRIRPVMDLDWKDVLRGAESLGRWLSKGVPTVEKEEANRRAEICTRCYFNVQMSGCSTCQAAVAKLAERMHSKYDPFLKSCAACKCALRLKVHFPNEILDKENPGVQQLYPSHCWQKKGGVNYRG